MSAAIRFEDVSKSFRLTERRTVKEMMLGVAGHRSRPRKVHAVEHLTFEVGAGESVALLGHNGSGKSTTLKMLAGTVAPSEGKIWARGRIAPLLELGAGFHPDLTGRENIFLNAAILGISKRETERRFEQIVSFAEVEEFLETPVKFYSSGMAVRLGFAIAANVDPEIVLIDEVLSVGDQDFQKKCDDKIRELQSHGRTILVVTHSLSQAKSFCSRAIVLHRGRTTYDGSIYAVDEAYARSSRESMPENSSA